MCYALLYTHNNRYSNFCLYCNLNLALNQNWVQNKSVHIKISFQMCWYLVLLCTISQIKEAKEIQH